MSDESDARGSDSEAECDGGPENRGRADDGKDEAARHADRKSAGEDDDEEEDEEDKMRMEEEDVAAVDAVQARRGTGAPGRAADDADSGSSGDEQDATAAAPAEAAAEQAGRPNEAVRHATAEERWVVGARGGVIAFDAALGGHALGTTLAAIVGDKARRARFQMAESWSAAAKRKIAMRRDAVRLASSSAAAGALKFGDDGAQRPKRVRVSGGASAPPQREQPVQRQQPVSLVRERPSVAEVASGLASARICDVRATGPAAVRCTTYEIDRTTTAAMNALHAVIDACLPTVRICEVAFKRCNDRTMMRQYLANKLRFVQLAVDPRSVAYRGGESGERRARPRGMSPYYSGIDLSSDAWRAPDCRCCAADTLTFEIDVAAPPREPMILWSSSLKWLQNDGQEVAASPSAGGASADRRSGGCAMRLAAPPGPLRGDIPLTRLSPGAHLHAVCRTRKGFGCMNACYRPATRVWYCGRPHVRATRASDELPREAIVDAAASCALGLLTAVECADPATGETRVRIAIDPRADDACTMCMNCTRLKDGIAADEPRRCVSVDLDDTAFAFSIETSDMFSAHRLLADGIADAMAAAGADDALRIERAIADFAAICAGADASAGTPRPQPVALVPIA